MAHCGLGQVRGPGDRERGRARPGAEAPWGSRFRKQPDHVTGSDEPRSPGGRPRLVVSFLGAWSNATTSTSRTFARPANDRSVRFSWPASTRWRYCTETSTRSAIWAWVWPASTRSSATLLPTCWISVSGSVTMPNGLAKSRSVKPTYRFGIISLSLGCTCCQFRGQSST